MRATPAKSIRNPLEERRDTKQCPSCKEWILSPGDREKLDRHILKEHPEDWERQEQLFRDITGTTMGSGRLPEFPRQLDEDELETRRRQKMAREKAAAAVAEANPKAEKEPREPKVKSICLCGCERETGGRFAPGHDATLKSRVINLLKEDENRDLNKAKELTSDQKAALKSTDKPLFGGRFAPNFK